MSKRKFQQLDEGRFQEMERPWKKQKPNPPHSRFHDMLAVVCQFLDFKSFVKITRVCKEWNSVCWSVLQHVDIYEGKYSILFKNVARLMDRCTEQGSCVASFSYTNCIPTASSGLLSNKLFEQFLSMRGSQIRKLRISQCHSLTLEAWKCIAKYCTQLQQVAIHYPYDNYFDASVLHDICKANSNLTHLSVLTTTIDNDSSYLQYCQNVHELELLRPPPQVENLCLPNVTRAKFGINVSQWPKHARVMFPCDENVTRWPWFDDDLEMAPNAAPAQQQQNRMRQMRRNQDDAQRRMRRHRRTEEVQNQEQQPVPFLTTFMQQYQSLQTQATRQEQERQQLAILERFLANVSPQPLPPASEYVADDFFNLLFGPSSDNGNNDTHETL